MADLASFSRMWGHSDYPPEEVNPAELAAAEAGLGLRLPASYRSAVLAVGLPRLTIALLHCIVENEMDLRDIGGFFHPDEMVESTNTWRSMGLPNGMIAFAYDSTGNLFAFAQASDDGQVYFFDHDERTTTLAANSFAAWIDAYCAVPWKPLKDCLND